MECKSTPLFVLGSVVESYRCRQWERILCTPHTIMEIHPILGGILYATSNLQHSVQRFTIITLLAEIARDGSHSTHLITLSREVRLQRSTSQALNIAVLRQFNTDGCC